VVHRVGESVLALLALRRPCVQDDLVANAVDYLGEVIWLIRMKSEAV
jgi:hypothetical protein